MKIEFLNAELTEARVTRGWWRWKRVAVAKRHGVDPKFSMPWFYVPSGDPADGLMAALEGERDRQLAQRRVDRNWQPVAALPVAKVRR